MSDDFIARLEHQLSAAERRQERGTRLEQLLASARVRRPARATLLQAVTAATAVIALVVGVVALTRGGERSVAPPPAHVVARLPTGQANGMTAGFGQVWINAMDHDALFRVDAARHRIVARIPVGRLPTGVATAEGAVWVIAHLAQPLTNTYLVSRIDPATDRVTARIHLTGPEIARLLSNGLPDLRASGDLLWVLGPIGGVRIDPGRNAVAGMTRWGLARGVNASTFALAGDDLWVHGNDGRLLRLDARDGAERARLSTPRDSRLDAVAGTTLILSGADGTVRRLDATTGHVEWTARLSSAPAGDAGQSIAVAGNTVWALRENTIQETERLTAIDLATGRITSSTALSDLGADGLTVVGGELWYAAGFQTVALSP